MGESPFDKLFTKSVPHILERVFFSLDYASFKKCMEVNTAWHELLTSESFKRLGKSKFCNDIERELWHALDVGNTNMVRRLLSSGMVDVNCTDSSDQTPLFVAAARGFKDVVHMLLEEGAEPNHRTLHFGVGTPLHAAAYYGNLEVAQLLLKEGADTNMEDVYGEIPLHCAKNQIISKVLLRSGSDLNRKSRNGHTPLNAACCLSGPYRYS